MKNLSTLLVAEAFLMPGAACATEEAHYASLAEAKAAAAEQKRLLLVEFFAED
jgi:hypothetical protein